MVPIDKIAGLIGPSPPRGSFVLFRCQQQSINGMLDLWQYEC